MHLTQVLLALGAANAAFAANVIYSAHVNKNPGTGTKGCPGGALGSVAQNGRGSSDCLDVGTAGCVLLGDHTGDATKCKVLLWSQVGCNGQEDDSNIFGMDGEYYNDNFASMKAVCTE